MRKRPDVCGAQPWKGDGSLSCELAPFHRGAHCGDGISFGKIVPGTSPRSPWKTQKRLHTQHLLRGSMY